MNGNNVSTNGSDDELVYQVHQIMSPHPAKKWHFTARVEEKSDARLGGREHDKLFGTVVFKGIDSGYQGDRSRIKAVVFSQSMEKIFNQLEVGEVYTISNAEVIRTNQNYPDPVQNPTQLILNTNSGTKIVKMVEQAFLPPSPKKFKIEEPAASCSSSPEPSLNVNVSANPNLTYVLSDLKSLKINQAARAVAVIKEILHNDTWGYAKCQINPDCDQEMQFDENEKLWECFKCEAKTASDFKWDPQLKIKICDETASIIAQCDCEAAGIIFGVSANHIRTLGGQKEIGKLNQLAMKAAFKQFVFVVSTRGKAAGNMMVRVVKVLTPTPEQTAFLFSKLIGMIDRKSAIIDRYFLDGTVKFESVLDDESRNH